MTDGEIVDAMVANPTYRDRREPKACVGCGYIRTVRVSFIEQYGRERDHTWNKHCRACEAEARARHYEYEAKRFRALACELRTRQQMGVQRRALGKRR